MRGPLKLVVLLFLAGFVSGCQGAPGPSAVSASSPEAQAVPATSDGSSPSEATHASRVELGPGWVVYQGDVGGGNGIFLLSPDGAEATRILDQVEGDLTHPDWSPDGRSLAFTVDGPSGVSIMRSDADGANATVLVACAVGCEYLDYAAWSPDGTQIAFTRYTAPGGEGLPPAASDLVLLDVATGAEQVVTSSSPHQLVDVARWSPDSDSLAFGIDRFADDGAETGSVVATVDLSTKDVRVLTKWKQYAYYPDWSKTSDLIVFDVETQQFAANPSMRARDLFVMRSDGTRVRRVTKVGRGEMLWQPSFTPSGDEVLAVLDSGGRRGVRVSLQDGKLSTLGTGIVTHPRSYP